MKTVFIYALCEPGTRTIRDIGKSVNPERRLKEHWSRSRKRKNHLGCWLSSLSERPALLILKEVPESEWQEWEQRYIRCARALGFDLVNATDGGDGGSFKQHSPESIAKMSAVHAGEKNPMFGKPGTFLGKKHTPEWHEFMSVALSGENNPMYHKKHTREARSKMRGHRPSLSGKNNPMYGKPGTMLGKKQPIAGVMKSRITRSFDSLLKICQPLE